MCICMHAQYLQYLFVCTVNCRSKVYRPDRLSDQYLTKLITWEAASEELNTAVQYKRSFPGLYLYCDVINLEGLKTGNVLFPLLGL